MRAERVAMIAPMLKEAYPPESKGVANSKLKPAMWENRADFDAKLQDLHRQDVPRSPRPRRPATSKSQRRHSSRRWRCLQSLPRQIQGRMTNSVKKARPSPLALRESPAPERRPAPKRSPSARSGSRRLRCALPFAAGSRLRPVIMARVEAGAQHEVVPADREHVQSDQREQHFRVQACQRVSRLLVCCVIQP